MFRCRILLFVILGIFSVLGQDFSGEWLSDDGRSVYLCPTSTGGYSVGFSFKLNRTIINGYGQLEPDASLNSFTGDVYQMPQMKHKASVQQKSGDIFIKTTGIGSRAGVLVKQLSSTEPEPYLCAKGFNGTSNMVGQWAAPEVRTKSVCKDGSGGWYFAGVNEVSGVYPSRAFTNEEQTLWSGSYHMTNNPPSYGANGGEIMIQYDDNAMVEYYASQFEEDWSSEMPGGLFFYTRISNSPQQDLCS